MVQECWQRPLAGFPLHLVLVFQVVFEILYVHGTLPVCTAVRTMVRTRVRTMVRVPLVLTTIWYHGSMVAI